MVQLLAQFHYALLIDKDFWKISILIIQYNNIKFHAISAQFQEILLEKLFNGKI